MAGGSKSNMFSIFGGKKRIPKDSYKAYLTWAIAVDAALFWLPGAGSVYTGFCYGMWWLNGYYLDKVTGRAATAMVAEILPFLPAASWFVWSSYKINKANTEPLAGEESEGGSRTEEAEGKAIRALQGRNRVPQNSGAEQPGGAKQGSGGSEKKAGGAGETRDAEHLVNKEGARPQGQSLKETPNKSTPASNKSVDGIAPQKKNEPAQRPAYQPTQPAFRRQAANDNAPTEAPESEELPDEDIEEPEQTETPGDEAEDGDGDGGDRFNNAKRVA